MKTFYTIILAILLPNIAAIAHSSYNSAQTSKDKIEPVTHENKSLSISLPEIICPTEIDTILDSRRECEAIIEYDVDFNDTNCPIDLFNLDQNFSDDGITAFSCSGDAETSHLRVFDLSQSGLPAQVFLTGIDVGVGFASSEPEITVNLYRLEGEFIYANMTLLESAKAIVPIISSDIFTVPTNLAVSNTDMIVVELVAPPFTIAQIPGYNIGGGQSAPSYIASPACNIPEPVDMATFGQPDFNLVLKLNASNFSLQQTEGLASGEAFPIGTTTNTFVLTDGAGNSESCSFDVNVSFGVDPFLICPLNINMTSQSGTCGAVVDFDDDIFILEPCAGDTIFQIEGLPSGSEFPIGFTRNAFVAQDIFGATDTCRFDVFVQDGVPPTFQCLDDIVLNVGDTDCGSVVEFEVIAEDFCGLSAVHQIAGLPSGFSFPVGVTTNTFVAIDAAGNSSQCSFNIIIEDGSPLSFVNCPADITVTTNTGDCGAIVNYDLPEVEGGNCDSIPISIRQNFSNEIVSSYGCDQSIESRHLRVFDMPRMGVNGDFLLESMEIGIGFADNNNPQIDINIYNLEAEEVLYENMTLVYSQQFLLPTLVDTTHIINIGYLIPRGQIVVIEAVVPEINTTRFIAGYSNQGEFRDSYFAAPACGFDEPVILSEIGIDLALVMELSGTVSNNILAEQTAGIGRGELFPLGTTSNTFTLDDGTACSFDITVEDGTAPSIECPADITVDILGNACDTIVMIDLPLATDNCGDVMISNNINNMESATDTYLNGLTPITFTATDMSDNTNTCTMNVLVNGSLEVDLISTDVSCAGGNDGSIELTILSGVGPFIFTWSNGQITEDLSSLTAGSYALTVQDNSQCTFQASVIIFEPTPLDLENLLVNNSVNDLENGNINLDIAGGTPPYTYDWNNGENEANITNLAPGIYTCTVTDANNCTLELGPFEVDGVVSTKNLVDLIPASLFPNPSDQMITVALEKAQFDVIQYQIVNTIGMIISAGEIQKGDTRINIDVQSFSDGLYYLVLKNEKGSSNSPFIVQH